MKFLVLWHFDLTRLGPEVARAVMQIFTYPDSVVRPATPYFKVRSATATATNIEQREFRKRC